MPCYKPIQGFHKLGGGICFTPAGSNSIPMAIPCGQCIGCRLERQTDWALRLCHEMKLHERSSFVTLTYDPSCLPTGSTLVKRHVQLFIKRLRKHLKIKKIRFFACGEYGEQFNRPHYHILIFGWEPDAARIHTRTETYNVYNSDVLAKLWPYGYHTWSPASPENCAYVSHYTVKKVTGDLAERHYERVTLDGEIVQIIPEFAIMSTRPGIGHDHYQKYESDFRNSDFAIHLGRKKRVPRYYDKLQERADAERLAQIKETRKQNARKHKENNTPERLVTREKVVYSRLSFNSQRKATAL